METIRNTGHILRYALLLTVVSLFVFSCSSNDDKAPIRSDRGKNLRDSGSGSGSGGDNSKNDKDDGGNGRVVQDGDSVTVLGPSLDGGRSKNNGDQSGPRIIDVTTGRTGAPPTADGQVTEGGQYVIQSFETGATLGLDNGYEAPYVDVAHDEVMTLLKKAALQIGAEDFRANSREFAEAINDVDLYVDFLNGQMNLKVSFQASEISVHSGMSTSPDSSSWIKFHGGIGSSSLRKGTLEVSEKSSNLEGTGYDFQAAVTCVDAPIEEGSDPSSCQNVIIALTVLNAEGVPCLRAFMVHRFGNVALRIEHDVFSGPDGITTMGLWQSRNRNPYARRFLDYFTNTFHNFMVLAGFNSKSGTLRGNSARVAGLKSWAVALGRAKFKMTLESHPKGEEGSQVSDVIEIQGPAVSINTESPDRPFKLEHKGYFKQPTDENPVHRRDLRLFSEEIQEIEMARNDGRGNFGLIFTFTGEPKSLASIRFHEMIYQTRPMPLEDLKNHSRMFLEALEATGAGE